MSNQYYEIHHAPRAGFYLERVWSCDSARVYYNWGPRVGGWWGEQAITKHWQELDEIVRFCYSEGYLPVYLVGWSQEHGGDRVLIELRLPEHGQSNDPV